MNPTEFLKTIYLGDRYCTKLSFDLDNNKVELYINCISRIRDKSGLWNYYNDENIDNGGIIITGVKEVILDKSGLLPNDMIYYVHADEIDEGLYEFTIAGNHCGKDIESTNLIYKIIGEGVHLFDPSNPDVIITE